MLVTKDKEGQTHYFAVDFTQILPTRPKKFVLCDDVLTTHLDTSKDNNGFALMGPIRWSSHKKHCDFRSVVHYPINSSLKKIKPNIEIKSNCRLD